MPGDTRLQSSTSCTGLSRVLNPSGTNETIFVLETSSIVHLGSALVVSNLTDYCGVSRTVFALNCTASFVPPPNLNDSFRDVSPPVSHQANTRRAFVTCSGEPSVIAEGPAWIVFERELTPARPDQLYWCRQSLPSNATGALIQWRHSGELSLVNYSLAIASVAL